MKAIVLKTPIWTGNIDKKIASKYPEISPVIFQVILIDKIGKKVTARE